MQFMIQKFTKFTTQSYESVYQYIIKIITPEQSYLTPDFLGSNDMVAIFRNYNVLTSKNILHTVHLTKSE